MKAISPACRVSSPTALIVRPGIQFLDFGFDPVRLKVREWGFHAASAGSMTWCSSASTGASANTRIVEAAAVPPSPTS